MEIINMDKSFVHLTDKGSVFVSTKRFAESNYTVSFFHLTEYQQSHPDYWEMHPNGDELVFVLEGKIQAEYIPTTGSKLSSNPSYNIAQQVISQGQAVIIPKGFRHRLLLVEESKMMVITKIEGTEHNPVE